MTHDRENTVEKITGFILKNKYVFLILVIGIVLLSLPSNSGKDDGTKESTAEGSETFRTEDFEKRLEDVLSKIDGAGQVNVLLAVTASGEKIIASDIRISENNTNIEGREQSAREEEKTAVRKSEGSGTNDVVTLKYIYPEFTGAVIIAEGAGSSRVRLDITEAVEAATGLTADKIKVIKMK